MLSPIQRSPLYLALIAAGLLAIWPLPGTIALRHLLLVAGVALSLPALWRHASLLRLRTAWPVWLLGLFFLWLQLHLALFAGNPQEQWHELRSDWLRALLAAFIGLGLGLGLAHQPRSDASDRRLELVLFAGLLGTVAIFFLRYLYEVFRTGIWLHLDFYMTPYKSKTPIVIFGAVLLPFAFIKLLDALERRERPAWLPLAIGALGLTVFADYFANTKNGFLMLLPVGLMFALALVRHARRPAALARWLLPVLLALLLGGGWVVKKHVESNPAWAMMWSDLQVGLDIDRHDSWKDIYRAPLPTNAYGVTVNESTYLRAAWARAGWELLKEHPMGYGLIDQSFGALAGLKWPDFGKPIGKTRGATHSGWLDLALGVGVPGLVMILLPLLVSCKRALGATDIWRRYVVWTVPTLLFAYAVTEVSADHFVELLFFLLAFFCGLTTPRPPVPEPPDTPH